MEAGATTTRAFRALYEAEYGFVWSAVRRFGVASALLEDAVQDTFIVAYRRRSTFVPGPARPWLYGIARGVASNYRRTARRVARKREALSASADRHDAGAAEALASFHALDRFLQTLPLEDRELFVLSEVEGLTGPELAGALGLENHTVYRRLRRLRATLAERGVDHGAATKRRPGASAASWAALVPSMQTTSLGWLTLSKLAIAGGVIATVSVGWGVAAAKSHEAPEVATVGLVPSTPVSVSVSVSVLAQQPPAPRTAAKPPETVAAAVVAAPVLAPAKPRLITVSTEDQDTLTRENALLRQAKLAVSDGGFQAALVATDRHAKEFPESPMADLRSVVRIEALCGIGKSRQARGEAQTLIAKNPEAPIARKLRREILGTCGPQNVVAGQLSL